MARALPERSARGVETGEASMTRGWGKLARVLLPALIAATGSASRGFAEQHAFTNYSVEHGLAQSQVEDILQDSKGYLWFATLARGVTRYDGVSFEILGRDEGIHDVSSLLEDSKGNVWLTTHGEGAFRYDGSTFFHLGSEDGLADDQVWSVREDPDGDLWFSTKRGVSRYDGSRFHDLTTVAGLSGEEVELLMVDRDGNLWLRTFGAGITRFDGTSSVPFTEGQGLADVTVWAMTQDRQGRIWFATADGVSVYDGKTLTGFAEHEHLPDGPVYDIFEDRQGQLWFATAGRGVLRYDGSQFTHFTTREGLAHDLVTSILEDREGNLWFGTDGGGLSMLGRAAFVTLDDRDGLPQGSVLAIHEDEQGQLWFGTDQGVSRYDGSAIRSFSAADGLDGGAVWSILEDSRGDLWFVSGEGSVHRFDGTAFEDLSDSVDLEAMSALAMAEDREGRIWFGTYDSGVSVYDGRSMVFYSEEDGLSSNSVWYLFVDRDGTLWVATAAGGVDRLSGSSFRHYSVADGFTGDLILTITQDTENNLWVGTAAEGIQQYAITPEGSLEALSTWTTRDGLVDDEILSLIFDGEGDLWAGSNRGVMNLDLTELARSGRKVVESYGKEDGVLGIECNQNAALRDRAGNLWFGTIRGVSRYDPSGHRPPPVEPLVHLTGLRLFYEEIDWSPYSAGLDRRSGLPLELRLPYDRNHLVFQYVGISLRRPRSVRYRYQLEGFDPGWTPVTAETQATYGNLAPGRYTFRLQARAGDGAWGEEAPGYSFVILAPFWNEWWFYLASGLGGMALVALLVQLRVRSLQRTRKRLEELVAVRTGELGVETEKVEAVNAELSAEKERLSVTLRSIGDGVISTDTTGRIELVNRVAEIVTGWGEREAQGRAIGDVFQIVDLETRTIPVDPLADVLAGGEGGSSVTAVLTGKSGEERFLAYSEAPIRGRTGHIVGAVVVFRDITEELRLERELQQAHRLESVGVLAGGIAHDFNNLLTGILGNLSLAKQKAPTDLVAATDLLAEAEEAGWRATGLTNQLLTFSSGGEPVKKIVAIGELVTKAVDFALRGSNVDARIEVADDLWCADVDGGQIGQVVNNLVLNADQAMPDGGTIVVRVENVLGRAEEPLLPADGEYVRVSVVDRGVGIGQEALSKIFDPYYSTKHEGSGLGLAIAYSIVKHHNGLITVESEPGRGSSFRFYLPAVLELQERQGRREEANWAEGSGRILAMDDDPVIRKVVSLILEGAGYEVILAEEGSEAIAAYEAAKEAGHPFDLVLADLTIPGGMGGAEAVRLLREESPRLKAIVISGYSNDPVIARFEEHGFLAALTKPFDPTELLALVRRVLPETVGAE